jgi:hypothetical protein
LTQASAYDTGLTTGTAATSAPGSSSNLFFSANRNSSVTAGTFNANTEINSLNFGYGGTTSTFAVSGTGTITIDAAAVHGNTAGSGITIASGGGSASISNAIVLGADQSFAPSDASSVLTVSGQVTGGHELIKSGAGTVILSSAAGNGYTGGTSVSAGTLYVNNTSGSGTGTGSVTVGSGATLAGSGTIKPTGGAGVTISGGATLAPGSNQTANAYINGGTGAVNATGTGGGLTLDNTEASSNLLTISGGAKLTFALGSTTPYVGGSGALNFAHPNTDSTFLNLTGDTVDQIFNDTTTALTINLVDLTYGAPSGGVGLTLRAQNPYLLIQTALGNNSDFANLVTTGGTGANGYVLGVSNGTGGYTAFNLGAYDINGNQINTASNLQNLQLYLYNGDLEVVPEPGTWALMLGGLALLVLLQRRRKLS